MGLPHALFISIALASLSTILTSVAICCWLLLRGWKRRDCIVLFSVLLADFCFLLTYFIYTVYEHLSLAVVRASSIFFATFLLTSWTSQFVVTLNRFVVINFPFTYKRQLSRVKLTIMSTTVWVGLTVAAFALVHTSVQYRRSTLLTRGCLFQDMFSFLPEAPLAAGVSILLLLLLMVSMMELLLWLTAYGHEIRYHSVLRSVSRNAKQSETTLVHNHKINRIKVRRIPFLLLGTHLVCILPFCIVAIAHLIDARTTNMNSFTWLGITGQALLLFRPTLNAIHQISHRKLRTSWRMLAVTVRSWSRKYPDLRSCHQTTGSDDYLPYEASPYRRESAMSTGTNVSVL